MTTMLRLRTLGVLCTAFAAVVAGAGAASAAPMSTDTLQRGSPSPDVLRVFDPDQREYNRVRTNWRRSSAYRHYNARHTRLTRQMRGRGRR